MGKEPLQRGEVIGIFSIILGVIVAKCPMTWWLLLILMIIVTLLAVYAAPRLRWTMGLRRRDKVILGIIVIVITGLISWYPIQEQYERDQPPEQPTAQESPFPFIDIELRRGDGYAYDIYVHNKSEKTLVKIRILRLVNPEKNKQKRAVRGELGVPTLKPLQKDISVLGPGEEKKIRRELSPSWAYTIFTVIYWDDLGKRYKCVYEGDMDGLRLTSNALLSSP